MSLHNWRSKESGLVVNASGQRGEIVSSLVLWKASAINHSNKLNYPRVIFRDKDSCSGVVEFVLAEIAG